MKDHYEVRFREKGMPYGKPTISFVVIALSELDALLKAQTRLSIEKTWYSIENLDTGKIVYLTEVRSNKEHLSIS